MTSVDFWPFWTYLPPNRTFYMNVPFADLSHNLIHFYFLGEEGEDNCDYVAVFLTSRLQGDLDVKYDFSVLKSDNTCWGRIGNTFKKFCPDQNSWGYGKAFSKAKLMEKQNELLPNGCLTIVCNLEIFYSDKTTQGRVSERMSCEDSAIFFRKSCTYPPFNTKWLQLSIYYNKK